MSQTILCEGACGQIPGEFWMVEWNKTSIVRENLMANVNYVTINNFILSGGTDTVSVLINKTSIGRHIVRASFMPTKTRFVMLAGPTKRFEA